MHQKKKQIIEQAHSVYIRFGIKSVTMDEMARQLGVSKKTIYQYVDDKNDLVMQCIEFAQKRDQEIIQSIIDKNENAIDEVLLVSKYISEELKKIHPSIFFDLAKYHPMVMNMIKCHKDEFIKNCMKSNLLKGIKEGLYRDNLNIEIISTLYLTTMDHVLARDIFGMNHISTEQIYLEVFRYHIRGIASDTGIEYLIKKISNNK